MVKKLLQTLDQRLPYQNLAHKSKITSYLLFIRDFLIYMFLHCGEGGCWPPSVVLKATPSPVFRKKLGDKWQGYIPKISLNVKLLFWPGAICFCKQCSWNTAFPSAAVWTSTAFNLHQPSCVLVTENIWSKILTVQTLTSFFSLSITSLQGNEEREGERQFKINASERTQISPKQREPVQVPTFKYKSPHFGEERQVAYVFVAAAQAAATRTPVAYAQTFISKILLSCREKGDTKATDNHRGSAQVSLCLYLCRCSSPKEF